MLPTDELPLPGPRATHSGRYTVRAVYQVDVAAEARFHFGIKPARLMSNRISLEINR